MALVGCNSEAYCTACVRDGGIRCAIPPYALRPAAWQGLLDAGGNVSVAMGGMLTLIAVAQRDQDLTQDEIAKVSSGLRP